MRLSNRGGGHGRPKFGEHRLYRLAQGCLHSGPRLRLGERRQAILQVRQVIGEGFTENIGARGQELTQLDSDRARALQDVC